MGTSIRQEKKAVDAGYWHLYRYDQGSKRKANPFVLDSEIERILSGLLQSEIRYTQLANVFLKRQRICMSHLKSMQVRDCRYKKLK